MEKDFNNFEKRKAFTLAEVLVSLAIGALILVAVLAVYSRAQRCSDAITQNLDRKHLASEVLQKIAEDLDGIIGGGGNVTIGVKNKVESHAFHTAQLEIIKTVYDDNQKAQNLEKIVWQGAYDYEGGSKSLILYRSHSGIAYEDKLLEQDKDASDRELFVPICSGITFFAIEVPMGSVLRESWTSATLPNAVTITISFAEPVKSATGALDVPDLDKIKRTIAIDRTRKLQFVYLLPQAEDQNQPQEPNKANEPNKPDEPNKLPISIRR